MGQPDAAVDGPVAQGRWPGRGGDAGRQFGQHDGAGAAVAFAAAFLGSDLPQVFAQQFQQGPVGWYIVQRNQLATPDETDRLRLGLHGIKYG